MSRIPETRPCLSGNHAPTVPSTALYEKPEASPQTTPKPTYSMGSDRILAVSRKPARNSRADIQRKIRGEMRAESAPQVRPPRQKKLITIVKVRESCAVVQRGNSAAIGPDSTLHAYTRPENRSTTHPTAT